MSKQVRKIMSMLLVLALVLQVFAVSPVNAASTAPDVGDGKINASLVGDEVHLSWIEANEYNPIHTNLEYKIYMSMEANIDTVSKATENGTVLNDYEPNYFAFNLTKLLPGTTYYFNVIVKNNSNEETAYTMQEVTTPFAPAPSVTADDEANTIVGADSTMEYSQNDGDEWLDYSPTDPPQFKGNKTVWVRVKANGSYPASLYTALTYTENTEIDPLDSLNLAKGNGDSSGVLSALQDSKLGLVFPEGFDNWSKDEKESLADYVMMMNGKKGYVSKGQVQYVLDLAIEPRNLFSTNELSAVEQKITAYFAKLRNLPEVFSVNLDLSIQEIYKVGKMYNDLSSVDKQIFAYRMTFYSMRDALASYKNRDQLSTDLSTYNPINTVTNQTQMKNVLLRLRLVQKESAQYNNSPATTEFMTEFPLNLDKVDNIDTTTYKQLAQWMIDKRPVGGYASYQAIQITFNQFFNPVADPLDVLNQARSTEVIEAVLEAIKQPEWLELPAGFDLLQPEEQRAVADVVMTLIPPQYKYDQKNQVQYALEVGYAGIQAFLQTDPVLFQQHLEAFYTLLSEISQSTSYPEMEMIQVLGQKYLEASNVDKQLMSHVARRLSHSGVIPLDASYETFVMLLMQYSYINSSTEAMEMWETLEKLYSFQQATEEIEPYEQFPLDFSKMYPLTNENREQLADHMISKMPNGGYATYEAIQTAFDKFFDDEAEIDPLVAVNEAKADMNTEAMLVAIQAPALNIQFPLEFEGLTEPQQLAVAQFLFKNIGQNYESKEQVQYMIELAVQAQSIWNERNLVAMESKLKAFAQKLIESSNYYKNDIETNLVVAVGNKYLHMSDADRTQFSFKFMYQLALAKSEGDLDYFTANGQYILKQLLLMPYTPITEATDVDKINQWLEDTMNDQLSAENFFAQNDNYDLTGKLNLIKRYDLDANDKRVMAEWVLEHKEDGYESASHLQYVINQFFTAPNVTGDDTKNTIIGLDSTMEISFNGGTNWLDVASMQRLDLSGNKTILVRYKAISDEWPGRAVKIIYTSNGETNSGGDSTTTNPSTGGGSTGGGSSSTSPVTSTPAPTTKQEQIVVDVNGVNGTNLTKTPITRTTENNGTIKDLVKMSEAIAKESVEKAKQLNLNTARIIIPDAKDSVSETRIELPKAAVKQLNDGGLNLEISTENAIISVPTKSIAGFDQDLYFRVVPMKQESERKQVEERAKKEQLIQQIAPNTNVSVLARPVEIETNMQSREVTLTLPLRDSLPTDSAARQRALDNLAVYIEHSDGTKELIQGKLTKLSDGKEGVEFTVNRFSTFTLVVVDGLKASEESHNPYINGFGADFRPDAFVTRAQMAAMLARNLAEGAGTDSANGVSYADVSATHWAASDVQKSQSAGIMNGMNTTQFAPEGSITRAQMATIAYRWMQQQNTDKASSSTAQATDGTAFTDVSVDQWASEAIAYVQSAGLMTGYTDGTFKPDSKLTRAEAVKVLNVLFKRTPAAGVTTPSFTDVPATHWAYADIEAAAQK